MNNLISSCIVFAFTLGAAACQPAHYAPANTGIEFKVSPTDEKERVYPDGVFHVQGLERRVSVHVPLAVPESDQSAQRLALPPGSYVVSFSPAATEQGLRASRRSPVTKVSPKNPFLIVVSEGSFTPVRVRTVDGSDAPAATQTAQSTP